MFCFVLVFLVFFTRLSPQKSARYKFCFLFLNPSFIWQPLLQDCFTIVDNIIIHVQLMSKNTQSQCSTTAMLVIAKGHLSNSADLKYQNIHSQEHNMVVIQKILQTIFILFILYKKHYDILSQKSESVLHAYRNLLL